MKWTEIPAGFSIPLDSRGGGITRTCANHEMEERVLGSEGWEFQDLQPRAARIGSPGISDDGRRACCEPGNTGLVVVSLLKFLATI